MKNDLSSIEFGGAIWMQIGGENFGGKGRIALLAQVAESGSITQAAKAFGMSYKAAWDAIDHMNNLAGEALVERLAGGKGGGGTRLTPRGEQLVRHFRQIDHEHKKFIDSLAAVASGLPEDFALIQRMNMKTSVRNQYAGRVRKILRGAINDEIALTITGGQLLTAIIPCEATTELGLNEGSQVFALVPSSDIILVTGDASARFSARNRLSGCISRIQGGAVNTEITLDLPGGGTLSAMITNDSVSTLGLETGQACCGIFKASSVILTVAA